MRFHGNTLRDYQKDMKRRVFTAWEHHPSVMVQMPTGTGKTHLIASIIHDAMKPTGKSAYTKEQQRVWIIAHRRELVEQIEETIARYGIRKEEETVKAMSIQWLSRHWNDVHGTPKLIVIDEAHHALAESYKELWSRYPDAKKLGMTATPCRLNGNGFTDLFDELLTSWSIADFIAKGWLSAFDYIAIRPDSDEQHLINGLGKRGADGDFQAKEMNEVLNRRPCIERLYESIQQYANGKKGIVYAINTDHARHIAEYYNRQGILAATINSKTPPYQRKTFVNDFKEGKIQVLVNVDIFSEGFDCPDVEFIQMARPTLSLAKYLQQVGRGLRSSKGKETCVLIDNVGLYRLFGLPTAHREWVAMFEGRMTGKGHVCAARMEHSYSLQREMPVNEKQNQGLEMVMTHERLHNILTERRLFPERNENTGILKAFKDRASGLLGLKRGEIITVPPQYTEVLDTKEYLATVRLKNKRLAIVNETGEIKQEIGSYPKAKILKDDLISVTDLRNECFYIDLKTGRTYPEKPSVLKFGNVEILKVGHTYCSRTKKEYKSQPGLARYSLFNGGFYLKIYDYYSFAAHNPIRNGSKFMSEACICLLENEEEEFYRLCETFADGSIIIVDSLGNYYHAKKGKEKQYIARENPASEEETPDTVIPRLKKKAEIQAERKRHVRRQEQQRKREKRLVDLKRAQPFQSGIKWGLKIGQRIVVPPMFRRIHPPIGYYCAFESNPFQWGIMALDGQVVVEARYWHVELHEDDTACLTIVPGKKKTVKLKI